MALKKFRRSITDKKICGLFGGLGESFDVDPTYLRLGFILLGMLTGVIPAIVAYAIGWVVTQPEDGTSRTDPSGDAG